MQVFQARGRPGGGHPGRVCRRTRTVAPPPPPPSTQPWVHFARGNRSPSTGVPPSLANSSSRKHGGVDIRTHMINFPNSTLNFDYGNTIAGYNAKGFIGSFLTSEFRPQQQCGGGGVSLPLMRKQLVTAEAASLHRPWSSPDPLDTMYRCPSSAASSTRDPMVHSNKQKPTINVLSANTQVMAGSQKIEDLNIRHVYNQLSRETAPHIRNEKHAQLRIKIIDKSASGKGYPPTAIEMALKAARRYRHPERAAANMPTTPRQLTRSHGAKMPGKPVQNGDGDNKDQETSQEDSEKGASPAEEGKKVKQTGIERALKKVSVTYGSTHRSYRLAREFENITELQKIRSGTNTPMSVKMTNEMEALPGKRENSSIISNDTGPVSSAASKMRIQSPIVSIMSSQSIASAKAGNKTVMATSRSMSKYAAGLPNENSDKVIAEIMRKGKPSFHKLPKSHKPDFNKKNNKEQSNTKHYSKFARHSVSPLRVKTTSDLEIAVRLPSIDDNASEKSAGKSKARVTFALHHGNTDPEIRHRKRSDSGEMDSDHVTGRRMVRTPFNSPAPSSVGEDTGSSLTIATTTSPDENNGVSPETDHRDEYVAETNENDVFTTDTSR